MADSAEERRRRKALEALAKRKAQEAEIARGGSLIGTAFQPDTRTNLQFRQGMQTDAVEDFVGSIFAREKGEEPAPQAEQPTSTFTGESPFKPIPGPARSPEGGIRIPDPSESMRAEHTFAVESVQGKEDRMKAALDAMPAEVRELILKRRQAKNAGNQEEIERLTAAIIQATGGAIE